MNALVFLYKQVLKKQLDEEINAVRATKKVNVPVVMTREETAKVITMMEGTTQLAVKLMYGSGLPRNLSTEVVTPSTTDWYQSAQGSDPGFLMIFCD